MNVDTKPIISAIRELVILLKEYAVDPGKEAETLALLFRLENINMSTYNQVFNGGSRGIHDVMSAEEISGLAYHLSSLAFDSKIPKQRVREIAFTYASGLPRNVGNSLMNDFDYETKKQSYMVKMKAISTTNNNASSLDNDDSIVNQKLSPVAIEAIRRLNPDRISGSEKRIWELNLVLWCIKKENNMLTSGETQISSAEFIAHQIKTGLLSPAEAIFFRQYKVSKKPSYCIQYKRYWAACSRFNTDWKRDLLQKLTLYVWINHPEKTLDYDEYTELVSDKSFRGSDTPVNEQPLSLLASMLMVDDIEFTLQKYRGSRGDKDIYQNYKAVVSLTYRSNDMPQ